jgi:hypothetical protein
MVETDFVVMSQYKDRIKESGLRHLLSPRRQDIFEIVKTVNATEWKLSQNCRDNIIRQKDIVS